MKKFIRSYGVYLLAILMICAFAFFKQGNKLSAKDFSQKMNATPNAQVLDVRTSEEFKDGYLENAVNINWQDDDFSKRVVKLDRSKPVFVYCRVGRRSSSAAKEMRSMGFREVYELNGGILEWQAYDLPVVH